MATLEDPVESLVPGVAQSQVANAAGFISEAVGVTVLAERPDTPAVSGARP